jgi:hypothetical protein
LASGDFKIPREKSLLNASARKRMVKQRRRHCSWLGWRPRLPSWCVVSEGIFVISFLVVLVVYFVVYTTEFVGTFRNTAEVWFI